MMQHYNRQHQPITLEEYDALRRATEREQARRINEGFGKVPLTAPGVSTCAAHPAPAEIYMVLGPIGPPRVKHNTKSSAQAEATRLAKAKPGQKFYVLRAIAEYEAEVQTYTTMKAKAL